MSISDHRINIRQFSRKYLELPKYLATYIAHINTFPGSGKTTILAEELDFNDAFFIYLTTKHDLANEHLNKHPAFFNLLQIESRARLCHNEEYANLANYGINIRHFCPSCDHYLKCTYYQRILEIWNEPQSWIGVHHHLGGLVNTYVKENDVDIIVLDEYFLPSILKHFRFGYGITIKTINLMSTMPKSKEKSLIRNFLQEFIFAIENKTLNNDFLYTEIYSYFHNLPHGTKDKLYYFAEEYEKRLATYFFDKGKIFTNIVTPIVRTIINVWRMYIPVRGREPEDYLKYFNTVMRFIEGDKRIIDVMYYDLDALDVNCKIMILDATTPTEFYRKLFMRDVKNLEGNLSVNSVIYQLTSAKYVMTTLDNSIQSRDRLIEVVDLIVKKHKEPILILSRKKYEEELKMVDSNLITTDHYPCNGSQHYEGINVVVAFGTPEPSHTILRNKSILLNCDENELLYLEREANILQGLYRIRPANKDNIQTYIYLLTNVELPFKDVKKVTLNKLEQILAQEVHGYVSEIEERIRENILSLLDENDYKLTNLVKEVKGNNKQITEVVDKLLKEDRIISYIQENSGKRGRKPVFYKLKE